VSDRVKRINDNYKNIRDPDLKTLTPEEIKQLKPEVVKKYFMRFDDDQYKYLTNNQISLISINSHYRRFPDKFDDILLNFFTLEQFKNLFDVQKHQLSKEIIERFQNVIEFGDLSLDEIRTKDVEFWKNIDESAFMKATDDQIEAIPPDKIPYIKPEVLNFIINNFNDPITEDQIKKISDTQISSLNVVSVFNCFFYFDENQFKHLSFEQIKDIPLREVYDQNVVFQFFYRISHLINSSIFMIHIRI
jgi:hypothetical protein